MNKLMALGVLALTATACGDKDDDTGLDAGPTDDELAAELWTEIAGYDGWNQVEDWTGVVESGAAHGAYVQIWYNDTAYEHVTGGTGDHPDGSIIVKEGYSDDGGSELGAITVMKKDAAYGSTGWFWAQYTDDAGTVGLAGDVDGCSGCHSAGQDYNLAVSW